MKKREKSLYDIIIIEMSKRCAGKVAEERKKYRGDGAGVKGVEKGTEGGRYGPFDHSEY